MCMSNHNCDQICENVHVKFTHLTFQFLRFIKSVRNDGHADLKLQFFNKDTIYSS